MHASPSLSYVYMQVAVALSVFYKSWSSTDGRLLAAAILLFIAVIVHGARKTFSLKDASIHGMQPGSSEYSDLDLNLEYLVLCARLLVADLLELQTLDTIREPERLSQLYVPRRLFLDRVSTSRERAGHLKSFLVTNDRAAYGSIEDGLSKIFSILYTTNTKVDYFYERWSYLDHLFLSVFSPLYAATLNAPLITAIVLFHTSPAEAFSGVDVKVTFVLLYGTLLLELHTFIELATFKWKWRWPSKVAQHSLLGFFIHNKRHREVFRVQGLARPTLGQGGFVQIMLRDHDISSPTHCTRLAALHTGR